MYELSMQAANVVQLGPGKVIAYAHNRHTIQALQENGIEVLPFEGKYLADNLGGPHCLTMPLLRKY
jgi:arginine deiminase